MGVMIDGEWLADERGIEAPGGTLFQDRITAPDEGGPFPAEAGRYHLYASAACPFSHRALVMRALKGLEAEISLSLTHPVKREQGWTFEDHPKTLPDPVFGATKLYQVFAAAEPGYSGRCAVPLLLDKRSRRIVSNDSAAILRMLATAFDGLGARLGDYRPADLAGEIDALNRVIAEEVNGGVYNVGFAKTQANYEAAAERLFARLDRLDARLAERRYLFGAAADGVRLVPPADPAALRCGLPPALQVQPEADRRLRPAAGLSARPLSMAGGRRHGRHGGHQGALLQEPDPPPQRAARAQSLGPDPARPGRRLCGTPRAWAFRVN